MKKIKKLTAISAFLLTNSANSALKSTDDFVDILFFFLFLKIKSQLFIINQVQYLKFVDQIFFKLKYLSQLFCVLKISVLYGIIGTFHLAILEFKKQLCSSITRQFYCFQFFHITLS